MHVFFKRNIIDNVGFLNKIIRKNKIDVIYNHFCETKILIAVDIVRVLNPQAKVVEHFHNHYNNFDSPLKKLAKKIIYSEDKHIGCSKGVAESLPFKKDKVFYATNGIYFPRLDSYEKIEIAQKGDFAILMLGRPYHRKGIDLAIRAIKKLNNPKIKLFISLSAGRGEFEKEMIADFGEVPNFATILEPRNDIATYYRNADLFISAAREEGFCYAIPEAMYCGMPVISSDIDGIPRDIPDLMLFESENVDELSEAIKGVYEGKNKFDKKNVKKYLEDNYSADAWAEKVLEILL